MPRADELYSTAKGIALDGVHLFRVAEKPVAPASIAEPVRLYLGETFVRCADGAQAVRRIAQERAARMQAGVAQRDLPGKFGCLTNANGYVTHWFAPSGLLYPVTYLGRSGEEATTALFRMPEPPAGAV